MPKLNADDLILIKKSKALRKQNLQTLIAKPFDLDNENHLVELNKRMNEFEMGMYQMAMYQAMSEGLKYSGIGWALRYFIPFDLVNTAVSYLFYMGLVGTLLENFSVADFHNDLTEMQIVYNWALKGGKDLYDPQINNDDKLKHADIQRLVKLLAPLSKKEFMMAWPDATKTSEEQQSNWGNVAKIGLSIINTGASLFSPTKPQVDLSQVIALKTAVEKGDLNKTSFAWAEEAVRYFATNPNFREIMTVKVINLVLTAKSYLPAASTMVKP